MSAPAWVPPDDRGTYLSPVQAHEGLAWADGCPWCATKYQHQSPIAGTTAAEAWLIFGLLVVLTAAFAVVGYVVVGLWSR